MKNHLWKKSPVSIEETIDQVRRRADVLYRESCEADSEETHDNSQQPGTASAPVGSNEVDIKQLLETAARRDERIAELQKENNHNATIIAKLLEDSIKDKQTILKLLEENGLLKQEKENVESKPDSKKSFRKKFLKKIKKMTPLLAVVLTGVIGGLAIGFPPLLIGGIALTTLGVGCLLMCN